MPDSRRVSGCQSAERFCLCQAEMGYHRLGHRSLLEVKQCSAAKVRCSGAVVFQVAQVKTGLPLLPAFVWGPPSPKAQRVRPHLLSLEADRSGGLPQLPQRYSRTAKSTVQHICADNVVCVPAPKRDVFGHELLTCAYMGIEVTWSAPGPHVSGGGSMPRQEGWAAELVLRSFENSGRKSR